MWLGKLVALKASLALFLLSTQLSSLSGRDLALAVNFFPYQLLVINPANLAVVFASPENTANLTFSPLALTPKCWPWLSLKNERSISETTPMKITFRQSGGYAGLIIGSEIKTDLLSAEEAATLHSLVQQSGIFTAPTKATPPSADLLNYKIIIETKEGISQLSFDELSLPESALPLLDYLQARAKPLR